MRRLKILISAHELSPIQGSECAEGWNIVTRLAKYHDITVLYATGSQFKPNSYLEAVNDYININGRFSGIRFINIDQPQITRLIAYFNSFFLKISAIGFPAFYFTGYKYWQKKAYKEAKRLHKEEEFDLAHQLTQITFREPGYLWKLDIPFVWGPTGGNSKLPSAFRRSLSLSAKISEVIRNISNFWQFNFVSRVKNANKKASVIYAFTKEDALNFQLRSSNYVKLMPDAGTYAVVTKQTPVRTDDQMVHAIWCGQLIERKSPQLLLKALAMSSITRDQLEVSIIGSGPLEESLVEFAKQHNLCRINWIREVSHEEIFNLMSKADFFVHTSYREATSNVIPEALSSGLPVVCHDVNGMSIAIDDSCGIKIPLISPEISANGFCAAMERLITEKEWLLELKKGASIRAAELSWDNMAYRMAEDYVKVLNNKLSKAK